MFVVAPATGTNRLTFRRQAPALGGTPEELEKMALWAPQETFLWARGGRSRRAA